MELSEKEKMIAGQLYFAQDPELVADHKFARTQAKLINEESDNQTREQLIKETFGTTGQHVFIEPTIRFDYGYNIHVGENFYANFNSIFLDVCPITIGDNCMFGPNVQLYTAKHPLHPVKRNSGLEFGAPITIGDNVWLGGGVILLPGVTLGHNVVVAAGAVVTKSVPANMVVGGNPAKIIKEVPASTPATGLAEYRHTIDEIDRDLVRLLETRMSMVTKVAAFKKANNVPVLDNDREDQVLEKAASRVGQKEYEKTVVDTFADIMKRSREYQHGKIQGE